MEVTTDRMKVQGESDGHSSVYRPRGLATMSPERRRAIARKGGQAAQARGTGHRWTVEEARKAGKKSSARYALRQKQSDESDQPSE